MLATPVQLEDDGLCTPEVGEWGEKKYDLISLYAAMFAKATRRTWQSRVYIDLFAGPGRARLEASSRTVLASPLLALSVEVPFDRYVFCDADDAKLSDLRTRAEKLMPGGDLHYVGGDVNANIERVVACIPRYGPHFKVLSFCVVDPYCLANLRFETIRRLSEVFVDFLVLIPTFMEANRFWPIYEDPTNTALEDFLGMSGWRERWNEPYVRKNGLGPLVVELFIQQMEAMRFKVGAKVLIRALDNNRPLYHLLGLSRHNLGVKLWRNAQKYSDPQRSLPFDD